MKHSTFTPAQRRIIANGRIRGLSVKQIQERVNRAKTTKATVSVYQIAAAMRYCQTW
jgi:hypothetical protein